MASAKISCGGVVAPGAGAGGETLASASIAIGCCQSVKARRISRRRRKQTGENGNRRPAGGAWRRRRRMPSKWRRRRPVSRIGGENRGKIENIGCAYRHGGMKGRKSAAKKLWWAASTRLRLAANRQWLKKRRRINALKTISSGGMKACRRNAIIGENTAARRKTKYRLAACAGSCMAAA